VIVDPTLAFLKDDVIVRLNHHKLISILAVVGDWKSFLHLQQGDDIRDGTLVIPHCAVIPECSYLVHLFCYFIAVNLNGRGRCTNVRK
jgi:hypothetical protein